MSSRLLRFIFACEFLLALIAIFTAWSEIGGQAVLDLMHWGWKLGLSFALAGATVAYSAALVQEESLWAARIVRWAAIIILLLVFMGVVTYFYALQVESGDSDETSPASVHNTLSALRLHD